MDGIIEYNIMLRSVTRIARPSSTARVVAMAIPQMAVRALSMMPSSLSVATPRSAVAIKRVIPSYTYGIRRLSMHDQVILYRSLPPLPRSFVAIHWIMTLMDGIVS